MVNHYTGCDFRMVIWPVFRTGQYRVNDHPYHTPQFNEFPILAVLGILKHQIQECTYLQKIRLELFVTWLLNI